MISLKCETECCFPYLGYKDSVDLGVVLEVLQDLHPLSLGGGSIYIGPVEPQDKQF